MTRTHSPTRVVQWFRKVPTMLSSFARFFYKATAGRYPYPYQERFATAIELPHLLRAPTSAGKTATAVLGWLFRWNNKLPHTPRRLVYCLPMRVLVEQSAKAAKEWIGNLGLDVSVHILMGGVDTEEWYLRPEQPVILIGTQDMLLSRALNRGYAASRFHWPIDFSLLSNDCLWVFDEPQLMANGVSTSAQLAGLRKSFGTFGECPSVWMSATLEPAWLDTIDFRETLNEPPHELNAADYDDKLPLHKRMTATKTLNPLGVPTSKDGKDVANKVLEKHQAGMQSLVILNTVDRAKAVYEELRKKFDESKLLLIHSRFRQHERLSLNEQLEPKHPGERIIVATQVVEAGVDLSCRTLITELCPWASVIQRIGRCNRTGDDGPGEVFWIDVDEKQAAPYSWRDLQFAREQLTKLAGQGASPKELDEFKRKDKIILPFEHKHVLRRRDLLDLFDTTPDLSGNDIDVSRFVRSDDPDTDVQVFWRDWSDQPEDEPSPERHELCNVPVGQFRQFLKNREPKAFVWDHLDGEWAKLDAKQLRPGLVILLHASSGGYSEQLGWDLGSKASVTPHPPRNGEAEEAADSDPNSAMPVPLTIAQHTENVFREMNALLKLIDLPDWSERLLMSARWHDVGKAHLAFQQGMRRANPALAPDQHWAKSGNRGKLSYPRRHFRHELASSLAALQHGLLFEVAYLIASHHGRVRLSIRSLPGEDDKLENPPPELFALGVYQDDPLPVVDLNGETCPATKLDLTPMRLGGESSWTGRALELLDELGPFKLAYLETLLRVADMRASRKEAGNE